MALFFFPEPPEEETPAESFRTLPEAEISLLEPKFLYLIRKARARQESLRELFEGINPSQRQICSGFTISSSSRIQSVARDVRKYFKVDLDAQYGLKTTDDAFKFWRRILETHGIFVFKDAFKEDECSGFCLYDETFPVIYVNNSQPLIRQIFTLFHELAHLLFKTGGIDLRSNTYIEKIKGDNRKIEIFCNKFAGEFLVPTSDFLSHIKGETINDKLFARLANKFSVSREVILRKLLDLEYVDKDYYEEKVKAWERERISRQTSTPGGDYYRTQGVYLGEYYIESAFSKYYKGAITRSELADYLDIKEKNVGTLEAYTLSKG